MKKIYFITGDSPPDIGNIECHHLHVNDELPGDARVFLVDENSGSATSVCRSIRMKNAPGIYLRPVILATPSPDVENLDREGFDGVFSYTGDTGASFKKILGDVAPVNSRIEQLSSISPTDTNIGMKIIRYLYVRSQCASPARTTNSFMGYSYPGIDFFLDGTDDSLLKILDFLEGQRVFSSAFFEKSYFCNQCHSAFLNFQEVCPHCKSSDLKVEDLIHHFSCAYVGASKEFEKGSKKICPKCDKELRHVGVDFDKPSIVYTCNPCGHTAQDPEITTTCFHCGQKTSPENLLQLTLKRYTLTSIGKSAALHGMDSLFRSVLEKNMPTIPIEAFKAVLGIEIQRIKRYKKSTSTLILIQFPDLDKIYLEYGSRAVDIFYELAVALKSVFRESDMVTSLTDSLFLAILVETPVNGANHALKRVHKHAERLFSENIGHPLKFCSRSLLIEAGQTVDQIIDEVTEGGRDLH